MTVATTRRPRHAAAPRPPPRAHGGSPATMPTESMADDAAPPAAAAATPKAAELHRGLRRRADRGRPATDRRIVAITAGMPTGTGLNRFQAEFPDRFFDVGIAEQHAVTLATGLAMGGQRPVVAIYSTFLQRAFDQTVHDVCQNDQPVVIAVDRAGLVGEDGTSHQGMFTLPAQRQLPNLVIASPKDEQELRSLVRTALRPGPPVRAALPARRRASTCRRSSRGSSRSARASSCARARDVLIVGFGPIVMRAMAGRRRAGRRGLVGRRSSTPASPSRSTASSSSTRPAASGSS